MISYNQLDQLFEQLYEAQTPEEVASLEEAIWDIWMESGSGAVDDLMEEGSEAMAAGDYTKAIKLFTRVTEKLPDYAEGWNKRATAYYLRGEYKASIRDINRTLALEDRHFGALSGLASIYLAIGDERGALRAMEAILSICPNQPGIQSQVIDLYRKLKISKA